MSLETRLSALITAIGADIKALQAASGGSSVAFYTKPRKTFEFFDDFIGVCQLVTVAGGTGAVVQPVTINPLNYSNIGLMQFYTGTDTTGRCAVRSQLEQIRIGVGKTFFAGRCYLNTLSSGGDTYTFRIGFGDNDTAESTEGIDCIYFEYNSAASANWRCVTGSYGSRTYTDSGVAVAAGVDVAFGIEVAADGSSAKFYINDTLVATISTNMPTASYTYTSFGAWMNKATGTTGRIAYVDWIGCRVERTTNR